MWIAEEVEVGIGVLIGHINPEVEAEAEIGEAEVKEGHTGAEEMIVLVEDGVVVETDTPIEGEQVQEKGDPGVGTEAGVGNIGIAATAEVAVVIDLGIVTTVVEVQVMMGTGGDSQ